MTTLERVARGLIWTWRATKAWASQFLAGSSSLLFIVWGSYQDKVWTDGVWWFAIAVVLGLGSVAAQIGLQRPSYMKLAEAADDAERASEAKSQAIEKALAVLCRKIAEYCNVAENTDRISVYYNHDGQFVMLARWSPHPEYTKPGRGSYPVDQGAIGIAWDRVEIAQNLPPKKQDWERSLTRKWGFPQETAAQLKMHCQSIAALRIDEAQAAVGVIVFESTQQDRATFEVLNRAKTSMLYAALKELVAAFATLTPRVESLAGAVELRQSQGAARPWKQVERPSPAAQA